MTKAPQLSYIGFSQGTAQAFAALSIHPQLNEKVNVFIALAPAMSPAGLAAPIVDGLMKASQVLPLFCIIYPSDETSAARLFSSLFLVVNQSCHLPPSGSLSYIPQYSQK